MRGAALGRGGFGSRAHLGRCGWVGDGAEIKAVTKRKMYQDRVDCAVCDEGVEGGVEVIHGRVCWLLWTHAQAKQIQYVYLALSIRTALVLLP